MTITSPLLRTDPRRLGPYAVLARLGGGGMGIVYLGEAPGDRLVAIKVIRDELADDPVFLARFRQEVHAASRVAGFCTARVLDAQLDAEQPWFVAEYVDGPTLYQAVSRDGPLLGPGLSTFAVGVAEALDAIHAAGVVHRDLKPSNVLLARSAPKVIDFGIARALDAASLTQTGRLIGTVNWLAPEQLRHDHASPLSDVFAWGGLVVFAATGRTPFGSGPPEALVHRILHQPPDLGDLAGDLRGVVAAALAKEPGERPTTRALLARLLGSGIPKAEAAAVATRLVQRTWTGTGLGQHEVAARPPAPQRAAPGRPAARPVRAAPRPAGAPGRNGALPLPAPLWSSPTRRGPHRAAAGRVDARDPSSAPRAEPGRRVLADALPGGLLRDLLLVVGFAVVVLVAGAAWPGPASRTLDQVTPPLLVAVAGAALLGSGRGIAGLLLAVVGRHLLAGSAAVRPGHLAGYGLVLLAMAVAGRLAGHGRLWRPLRAVVGLAAGYALLEAGLLAGAAIVGQHLPAVVPLP